MKQLCRKSGFSVFFIVVALVMIGIRLSDVFSVTDFMMK